MTPHAHETPELELEPERILALIDDLTLARMTLIATARLLWYRLADNDITQAQADAYRQTMRRLGAAGAAVDDLARALAAPTSTSTSTAPDAAGYDHP